MHGKIFSQDDGMRCLDIVLGVYYFLSSVTCMYVCGCHCGDVLWLTFAFSALTLLVGWQRGYPACENFCFKTHWNVVMLIVWCKWVGYSRKYPVDNPTCLLQRRSIWRVLACTVRMLKLKMTGDCTSGNQLTSLPIKMAVKTVWFAVIVGPGSPDWSAEAGQSVPVYNGEHGGGTYCWTCRDEAEAW